VSPLKAIESFVRAEVNVLRSDKATLNFGHYRFATLPRISELVSVKYGDDTYDLLVREVKHTAYTEDSTPTLWDAMTVLNCEIVHRAEN